MSDERRPVSWLLILGAWTLYGVLASTQAVLSSAMRGVPLGWTAFVLQMPQAWMWALATPVIIRLGHRFPLQRGRWITSIAVHVAASCALVFAIGLIYSGYSGFVLPSAAPRPVLRSAALLFVIYVVSDGMLYWVVLLLDATARHQRKLRERELRAAQLETQLVRADLQALKMQLQPHFLFNALHTIGSLVRTGDRDKAVTVVARLGDLLRRLLDGASEQEVPLEQELAFIGSYLEIEQIRFSDRLRVTMDIAPGVLGARVPHMILQPLVENAIRHGIAPRPDGGLIVVGGWRVGERLELVVRDDGAGFGEAGTSHPGIGLANTRARLSKLYGDDYRLDVLNGSTGGVEARLSIPYAA